MIGMKSKDTNQGNVENYTLYDHFLKGASSMEEHLLYKQMDGGLIPSCSIMTKYTIKYATKYVTKSTIKYTTKYVIKYTTKYLTSHMIKYNTKSTTKSITKYTTKYTTKSMIKINANI